MGNVLVATVLPGNPTQAWQFSDLITGYNTGSGSIGGGTYTWGNQNDGGTNSTAVWNAGGFLRITSGTSPGTFGPRFSMTATGHTEICVQFDIRRNTTSTSKILKTYGWGLMNGGNYSNATWCASLGGYVGTAFGVGYGDAAAGSNDITCTIDCTGYPTNNLPNIGYGGSFSRTPYPTQTNTTPGGVNMDTSGTIFERYMVYSRSSSNGTNDGQMTIWQFSGGVWAIKLNLTNQWNCSANTQDRGGFGLFEFTPNASFFEDYANLFMMLAKPVGMGI